MQKNPNGGNFQFDERKWQLDLTDTILVEVSKRGKKDRQFFLFEVSNLFVYCINNSSLLCPTAILEL